ncbi:CHAT domain-containing protein [Aeromicrobium sp. 636]|uniref:CHAT domain-containing protein n=1 Tax=Aeromicrobium senzhongii TaxID=2663859 RepID=A0A8I0ETF8_9ACTN|nr:MULTISPECIES: CHAT domain-containing protein [Aeromicrobium]MBC9225229.1 CHAT domain-containing protein [Aeromicrobium senzhongii]MCQ3997339.1 CHAT domain-containing protein [Aeromicrobium sp. 636]
MLTAQELHRRGLEHLHQWRYASARREFQRALTRDPSLELQARILVSLALAVTELGEPETGLELCGQAHGLGVDSPQVTALITSQEAALHQRRGEYDRSLALYEQSIDHLPDASLELANSLNDLGVVRLRLGDFAAAERDFARAAAAFQQLGDAVGHATAQHNSGYAAMRRWDLATALRLMEAARPVLAEGSQVALALVDQDRAEALLNAGMASEAIGLLEASAAILGRHRHHQMRAECDLVAARALLATDPQRSRRLARLTAQRLRRIGSESWALRAEILEAVAQARIATVPAAWLPWTDRLAAALRERRLDHEAQLLDLNAARAAIAVGDLTAARNRMQRSRTTSTDSLTERLLERAAMADLALAEGSRDDALAHLRAGLGLLHDWQSTFGSLDMMSSVVGHGRGLAASGIRLTLDGGSPELVFEWSERARALTTRVVPVRPPRDGATAADLMEIRALTVAEPEPDTSAARRLENLRERVRQRAWLDAGSGEVNEICALDDLERALGHDSALVSYVWDGAARISALVVTDAARSVVDLGASGPILRLLGGLRADLDVSAGRSGDAIARVVRAGLLRRLGEVGDALVAPLLDRVGDRRVVVTQAGVLAGIPWSMLPGFAGRPVTVASAATRWLATRGLPQPRRAAFVAGPEVVRATEEVKQSAARWPRAVTLTDDAATVAATLAAAGQVDLLHISAHGRHAVENPLFSGLRLADGPLFGYDLDELARVPDVVILSACEVGRSTQRWAEESLGMVNAWLHAGARCVIASPAAVADDEACELLQDVHRLMAGGTPPAVALAEATADRPTSFVCFGAGW